jgi:PAB1-binding protein PBP1
MEEMDYIVINGQVYVKVNAAPSGTRAVIVIDRGWIFAGDVTEEDGHLQLDNATWVFRWSEVGFNGVIDDPKDSRVELRQMSQPVQVPMGSVIFRVPVPDGWGR